MLCVTACSPLVLSVPKDVYVVKKKYARMLEEVRIKNEQKFDLEKRLIRLAVLIIKISQKIESSKAGMHMAGQLVRSGTSPALNYGEAQSSESRKDFIHKIKIVLKELRETKVNLLILAEANLIGENNETSTALNECSQLIAIFVKSVETASDNLKKENYK